MSLEPENQPEAPAQGSLPSISILGKRAVQGLTMRKEYPIQRLRQPRGHCGMVMSWLCTAMACEGASHTEHRLMYWGIWVWPTGIMGMGAVVDSQ